MNPTTRPRRTSIRISDARWRAYAAAGMGTTLLGLTSADAAIHYSGIVNHTFSGHSSEALFPLNNGASLSFQHVSSRGGGAAHLAIPLPGGGYFSSIGDFAGVIVRYGGFYLSKLASGVSLTQLALKNSCRVATSISSTTRCYGGEIGFAGGRNGNFLHPGSGFIGFVYNAGAGSQYGWARIKTTGNPYYRFVLFDYAWGDPGDSIQTGQKHDTNQAAVTPSGSLGLLAFGNAGLIASREKREIPLRPD